MNRRKFIALAGGAAVGGPVAARAQQPSKAARIGMLGAGRSVNTPILNGFRDGLRLLGYVEGENIFLEHRFSEGHSEQYRALAKELVNLKVDVIVAPGTPEALAAKEATSTIPIVTVLVGDPIGSGLVVSLARPGGNITGMSSSATDTMAKQLELLKEVAPQVSHVAVLWDRAVHVTQLKELEVAARTLHVRLHAIELTREEEIEGAFAEMTKQAAEAIIVLDGPFTSVHRQRIAGLAIQHRLPTIVVQRLYPEAGALMSYGANRVDLARRAATYIDKILKGAKPADLPVEQPTKFELVINLKTAKALGVTIPPLLLARADEVIE